jgi:nitrogen fixation protein NifB
MPSARFLDRHPCFAGLSGGDAETARVKYGRIHLPVSPECNIGCLFCARGVVPRGGASRGAAEAEVPGQASRTLEPDEAIAILERALAMCPEISVVGVAGPGDSLVTDRAIETLEKAKARFPALLACLSTNGLLLREKAARLGRIPVDSITVTVNSLRPGTLERIVGRVELEGAVLRGRKAAEALIEAQVAGIAEAAARTGAVIKINTVLIPGLNDGEIAEISRRTASLGASVMNVIPLIPQAGMAGRRAPDCSEIEAARREASDYLEVFRHCGHCRADAAGLIGGGRDIAALLYGEAEGSRGASREGAAETFSHG